jgi:hypothetical protein
MLYKLIQGQDVFELNPGLRAVEAYNKLTSQQMFFVLLVVDPSKDNPIKTLSGKERRERAAILAGYKYEADGKRLDKNARNIAYGKIPSVEEAIEEFKRNHYNSHTRSIEAVKRQITEIQEYLESDKKVPMIANGKIILDKKGEEKYVSDPKALKYAIEVGKQLPDLEKALQELESKDPVDKFVGQTMTAADLDDMSEVEGGEGMSMIDMYHLGKQQKQEEI